MNKSGKLFFLPLIVSFLLIIPPPAFSLDRRGYADRGTRGSDWNSPLVGQEITGEYYLGIGDQLRIFVMKNPDLSGISIINPDGMLYYPLIGKIKAAGLTIEQLQSGLKEKLSEYVRYPDITITIESMAGKKVVVLGEVLYPGVYTYEGQITLVEAIGLAGDVTRDAKRESIIIVRDNVTDHPSAVRVDFFKTIREGSSNSDNILAHTDIVYVPRHFIADVTEFMENINVWLNNAQVLGQTWLNFRSLARKDRY